MRRILALLGGCLAATAAAPAASADTVAPASTHALQQAVDGYLGASADPLLVGGAGSAGYDGGFWIRGGETSLRINVVLQARYEALDWDDERAAPTPGRDLSGFSMPRTALLLSGTAPCRMSYLAMLEFGHHGGPDGNANLERTGFFFSNGASSGGGGMPGPLREGWIEHEVCEALNLRMGMLKLPNTRQLMVPAPRQQFVDKSLAAVYSGQAMFGYLDVNRDFGFMAHGRFGRVSYMATVSNGDGATVRNVLNQRTEDNLAYAGRVDFDVLGRTNFNEGAVYQDTCPPTLQVGAWAAAYHDQSTDGPHVTFGEKLGFGVDLAAGWGGFALTAAYNVLEQKNSDFGANYEGTSWLAQVSYLFPGTAWEVAARASAYTHETEFAGDFGATELAGAITYYLNAHWNKLTLDVAFITPEEDGHILGDVMAGYSPNGAGNLMSDQVLLRFQWQLVL